MVCRSCIDPHYRRVKGVKSTMMCNKCNNTQFYTKYNNGIPKDWICSHCGNAISRTAAKRKKETKEVDKNLDNTEE